jgi:ferredoxin
LLLLHLLLRKPFPRNPRQTLRPDDAEPVLAVVDAEKCTGCGRCLERCPFEAIELKPGKNPKQQISVVDPEKCKGCGLCIITCAPNALTYEIVRPPEYLKPKPVDGEKSERPVHEIPVWGHYFLK